MHHPADLGRALLPQDGQRIFRRRARMHDQWLAAGARRPYMAAETLLLRGHGWCRRIVQPEVVEPGLADRDHAWQRREVEQPLDGGCVTGWLVRMNADRRVEVRVRARQRMHARKVFQVHRHAERMRDTGLAHPGQHALSVGGKCGIVEMAVRIDVHGGLELGKRGRRLRDQCTPVPCR